MTALEAMIGAPKDAEGIDHHVVNYYYNKEGQLVHKQVGTFLS